MHALAAPATPVSTSGLEASSSFPAQLPASQLIAGGAMDKMQAPSLKTPIAKRYYVNGWEPPCFPFTHNRDVSAINHAAGVRNRRMSSDVETENGR
jgi:hypothetical protein